MRSTGSGTGCRTGCRSGSRTPRSSRGAGRSRTEPLPRTAHQHRADEAEHEVEEDRRGEGPRHMRAQPERPRAPVGAHPPQQDRERQEEAGDQPPAAPVERRQAQPVPGCRRLQREPRELADELHRIPADRGPHVEADDLDGDEAAEERRHAEEAEVDRADLRIADAAEQPGEERRDLAAERAARQRRAVVRRGADLHLREDVLVVRHVGPPSLAPDRQVEPPAPPLGPAARPERPADDDAHRAPEARGQREEQPEAVDAERADRVADRVAEERVLVLGRLDPLARLRIGRREDEAPCSDSANAVVKKNVTASMCAGL